MARGIDWMWVDPRSQLAWCIAAKLLQTPHFYHYDNSLSLNVLLLESLIYSSTEHQARFGMRALGGSIHRTCCCGCHVC